MARFISYRYDTKQSQQFEFYATMLDPSSPQQLKSALAIARFRHEPCPHRDFVAVSQANIT